MLRTVAALLALAILGVGLYLAAAALGLFGSLGGAGSPAAPRVPQEVVRERERERLRAAAALTTAPVKQVLFGDLHVHTTFSSDAFLWSLPMMQGEGVHPVSDACDFARFCSALDFWSINDHAEASTPRKWRETIRSIRECNAVSGDPADPDVVAYLGWEWSQVGRTPEDHYGHKNVILRDLEDGRIPTRPIGAGGMATDGLRGGAVEVPWYLPFLDFPQRDIYFNFLAFLRELREVPDCPQGVPAPELPADCYESAATPAELFAKLREWRLASLVIPHGNTWGFYSPPGITWDKQLAGPQHDPEQQVLVEIMSGHGNSEEYRSWRAVRSGPDGRPLCPEPTADYLPSCWRAGEIIRERCLAEGTEEPECEARAAEARRLYAESGVAGHRVVRGESATEWLDAGQCRDCFRPSFNYRPGGSTQYALAISNFDDPGSPRRFRFGVIASSDNHRARPGTGYKEVHRLGNTEAAGPRDERIFRFLYPPEEPLSRAVPVDVTDLSRGFASLEAERQSAFFTTGGLAAVHATGRSREAIWEALERREVYGTSGERILLWFHLLNVPGPDGLYRAAPMGSEVRLSEAPRFEVRAVGSFRQRPGCPEESLEALSAEALERLCYGECYHPSDERKLITRIEVVRIRPQQRPGEPVGTLIEDPWKVLPCPPDPAGCVVRFRDEEFEAAGRDTVYYVRAIEEPTPTINADPLRCTYDEQGRCIAVDPCFGDYRTAADDDCTSPTEERAWSSPIFVDAAAS